MTAADNSSSKFPKTKSHPFWQWFWLSFLVVSLAYAWYSFYAPSNDIKWSKNSTSVQNLKNISNNHALLFFTGEWCSPCRIMKREVFADKEVSKVINSQFTPVIIDVDDPNAKELVQYYKVNATPTTLIIDSEGKVMDKAIGKIDKEEFLEILSKFETHK